MGGCRLVGGGTGGDGTRCRCKKNMRQQQTKQLRSWEGPSANGREGGSKKCGWDVVEGRGRSGRGKRNEAARRGVGVKACGEVEVCGWMREGGGRGGGGRGGGGS